MPTDDEYREEFENFVDSDITPGSYDEEVFDVFYQIYQEAGAPDDLDTFYEFLNTFYPDVESHDKQFYDDLRESFYEYTGLTGNNIDWELWRAIVEEITPGGQ